METPGSDTGGESLSGLESDEEAQPQMRAYTALLSSLTEPPQPSAKRRKLNLTREFEMHYEETNESIEPDKQIPEDIDLAILESDGVSGDEDEILKDQLQHNDCEDLSDPFERHFSNSEDPSIPQKIKAIEDGQWTQQRAVIGRSRLVSMYPNIEAAGGAPPRLSFGGPESIRIKERLRPTVASVIPKFDDVQSQLAPMLFNYQDIFYCQRTVDNSENLRNLVVLHALNHIFKFVFSGGDSCF